MSLPFTDDEVTDVVVKYFDTVPISNSMCVLRNGFLFVAAEFGNHMFYQFQGLGDDTDGIHPSLLELLSVPFYFGIFDLLILFLFRR